MAKPKDTLPSQSAPLSKVQQLRTAASRVMSGIGSGASTLMQRMSIANAVGYMYNGQRDLYAAFGYKRVITFRESWQRYRRQDIASRVIDAPVNALWSNPPQVTSTDPAWNAAWNDLVINKDLWRCIRRVDKMAGLGDYAVLLIGFSQSGSDLSVPISNTPDRKVLYFQPYDYGSTTITRLVSDPANQRFMKPEMYRVQPATIEQPRPVGMSPISAYGVHHSRILHVAENVLSDEIFGNPRIERIWNLLDDLLKVTGGTAETYWIVSNKGLQVDVDKDMDMTPEDEASLTAEIEEYINDLRRVIRTRGVTVKDLGTETPSPQQVFIMIMQLISGTTGIPMRILLGSEAGQMASGQDRNNWAERIQERRADFGEPVIIWPLIRILTLAGVLPAKDGALITIKWPPAFQLTPLETNQAKAQQARSAANVAKAMATSLPAVTTTDAATGATSTTPGQAVALFSREEGRTMLGLDEPATAIAATDLIADGDES